MILLIEAAQSSSSCHFDHIQSFPILSRPPFPPAGGLVSGQRVAKPRKAIESEDAR